MKKLNKFLNKLQGLGQYLAIGLVIDILARVFFIAHSVTIANHLTIIIFWPIFLIVFITLFVTVNVMQVITALKDFKI